MLPKDQIEQIKKQIISQIESNFPEDKKDSAKKQIEAMDDTQLEEFLKQNNLVKTGQDSPQQCIFCSIVFGDVQSHKIDENEKAIAILEINPISYGHTIIIPKDHIPSSDKMPNEAQLLADEISKKIKTELNPKDVIISSSNLFGHEIINVLPIYKDENINSKRYQAKPKELQELQKKLMKKIESKIIEEPKEEINEKNTWLPKRIP
jgi:diadenosine tetraphosphate (Ap4A) HIT family hydrolase